MPIAEAYKAYISFSYYSYTPIHQPVSQSMYVCIYAKLVYKWCYFRRDTKVTGLPTIYIHKLWYINDNFNLILDLYSADRLLIRLVSVSMCVSHIGATNSCLGMWLAASTCH